MKLTILNIAKFLLLKYVKNIVDKAHLQTLLLTEILKIVFKTNNIKRKNKKIVSL